MEEKKQFFCGVEQEAKVAYPFLDLIKWFETGGRMYMDCNVTEINTALIPVTEDQDTAVELHKAILADRARILHTTKETDAYICSSHFNFSINPKLSLERIIRCLGPTLAYFFARTEQGVGFRIDYGSNPRLELNSGHLNTEASIIGGSAVAIAALTALSTGELSLDDFEYQLSDKHKIVDSIESNRPRYTVDFYEDSLIFSGRDAELETNKGTATIEQIISSTIKTLKPFIEKYCSEDTFERIQKVCEEEEETDLDLDLLFEDGEISYRNDYKITRKALLRQTKERRITDIIGNCPVIGPARLFGLCAEERNIVEGEGSYICPKNICWEEITFKVKTPKSMKSRRINIKTEHIPQFIKIFEKYRNDPSTLCQLTSALFHNETLLSLSTDFLEKHSGATYDDLRKISQEYLSRIISEFSLETFFDGIEILTLTSLDKKTIDDLVCKSLSTHIGKDQDKIGNFVTKHLDFLESLNESNPRVYSRVLSEIINSAREEIKSTFADELNNNDFRFVSEGVLVNLSKQYASFLAKVSFSPEFSAILKESFTDLLKEKITSKFETTYIAPEIGYLSKAFRVLNRYLSKEEIKGLADEILIPEIREKIRTTVMSNPEHKILTEVGYQSLLKSYETLSEVTRLEIVPKEKLAELRESVSDFVDTSDKSEGLYEEKNYDYKNYNIKTIDRYVNTRTIENMRIIERYVNTRTINRDRYDRYVIR